MNIKVFIIGDHAVVTDGLRILLEGEAGVKVAGNAPNRPDTLSFIADNCPDVTVVVAAAEAGEDIKRLEGIRKACPSTQIVMVVDKLTPEDISRSIRAGANGLILAESASSEIANAIRTAYRKERRYLSQKLTASLVSDCLGKSKISLSNSPLSRLSVHEREVFQLVAEGKTSKEIAEILSLSAKTVNTYRYRIMEKLGISDIPGLVRFAIQSGLTPLQ
jgi:two-component system, NarL family, response regulator NreC